MYSNSRFAVSVHVLAYLAYQQGRQTTSAEIARSVNTNPVVIRRLLAALIKARLVSAQKGARGGFALASAPANISLLDIYRAVEPAEEPGLARFAPNAKCPVGAKIESILKAAFFKAQTAMEAQLAALSLQDVHQQLKPVCTKSH